MGVGEILFGHHSDTPGGSETSVALIGHESALAASAVLSDVNEPFATNAWPVPGRG